MSTSIDTASIIVKALVRPTATDLVEQKTTEELGFYR